MLTVSFYSRDQRSFILTENNTFSSNIREQNCCNLYSKRIKTVLIYIGHDYYVLLLINLKLRVNIVSPVCLFSYAEKAS